MQQILAFLALTLFIAGCALLDPSPEATVTNTSPPVRPTTGEGWYRALCSSCHNPDGSPVSIDVTDLRNYEDSIAHHPSDPDEFYRGTWETYSEALEKGPDAMPIFSLTELDSTARRQVYEYIRTLRK